MHSLARLTLWVTLTTFVVGATGITSALAENTSNPPTTIPPAAHQPTTPEPKPLQTPTLAYHPDNSGWCLTPSILSKQLFLSTLEGEITGLDPATNTMTVTSHGTEHKLTITPTTQIMEQQNDVPVSDLKVGDNVWPFERSSSISIFGERLSTVVTTVPLALGITGNMQGPLSIHASRMEWKSQEIKLGDFASIKLVPAEPHSNQAAHATTMSITRPDQLRFMRITALSFAGLAIGQKVTLELLPTLTDLAKPTPVLIIVDPGLT